LNRRESRASQRISSTQEAADPGDGLSGGGAAGAGGGACRSPPRTSSNGGAGQASGPSVATILVLRRPRRSGSKLRPGPLLGPELAQAAARGRPRAGTRTREGAVLSARRVCRRPGGAPADIRWISSERSPNSTHRHLRDPPPPRSPRGRPGRRAAGRRSSSRSSPAPAPISTSTPPIAAAVRRATISTSGQLGHPRSVNGRGCPIF